MQTNHDTQDPPGILGGQVHSEPEAGRRCSIVFETGRLGGRDRVGVRNRRRGWAEESSGGIPRRSPRPESPRPKLISPATAATCPHAASTPPPIPPSRPFRSTSFHMDLTWVQTERGRHERTTRVPDRLSKRAALCRPAGVSPRTDALLHPREKGSSPEPARGLPATGRGSHPRPSNLLLR